jgi:P27 family predicted phage terminase small subunit
MVRGRKPIPTAVNKIMGRVHSNRMPPNEPTIGIPRVFGLPLAPPTYLDDYAADEWQRTWESLWDAGIVTHVDVGALAIYCQAHARWRRAEEAIQEIAKEAIQRTAVSCWSRPTATSFKIHWSELQTLLCGTRSDTGQNLASRLRVAPASA